MSCTPEPAAELFARRLRRLIEVSFPAAQGRPYTDIEIGRHTGLSNQYVGKLRKGQSVPSLVNAGRLARLFGVSTDYFLSPPDHPAVRSVERDLRMVEARRAAGGAVDARNAGLLDDEEVRRIAEGAAELPPAMRGPVRVVIEQLRKAVGLGGGDESVRG
ncbi:helix-turn-helix transcriptional regulator [Streptomyces sp. NPDC052496]|uniref:helix-turn-helix domain-containing protein n=1 Tax=Streptomyces sp. NPDC052496 TaxID=3154951 RepID=UPI003440DC1D